MLIINNSNNNNNNKTIEYLKKYIFFIQNKRLYCAHLYVLLQLSFYKVTCLMYIKDKAFITIKHSSKQCDQPVKQIEQKLKC